MNTTPLFSVIMNCRNSARYLREAIDSVRAQTIADWEIVFLDNESTDESPAIAQGYGDPRIRYVRNAPMVSLGEARNLALKHARGTYISFLDCDDVWLPELLAEQKRVFESDSKISFVHGSYHTLHEPQGYERLVSPAAGKSSDELGRQLSHYQIGILTASVRRDILESQSEWFDPALTLAEDVDLFLRLIAVSKGGYFDRPLAKYRIHGNNLSLTLKTGWADELQTCLDKLRQVRIDLDEKYPAEIHQFLAKIAYLRARDRISQGKGQEARLALEPYRFDSFALFVCYVLAFFPYRVWSSLYRGYYYLRYRN